MPEEHGHLFAPSIESSCWSEKPAAPLLQSFMSSQLIGLTWIIVKKLEETMCVILKQHREQRFAQEIAALQSDFEEEPFII